MHGSAIPQPGFDAPDDVGLALACVEGQVRLVLTLQSSRDLRMAALGGRAALRVQFDQASGWGLILPTGLSLSGGCDAPDVGPPSQSFTDLVADRQVTDTLDRVDASGCNQVAAERLVKALLVDDRAAFRELLELAPAIEAAIYAIGAQMAVKLDMMRRDIQDARAETPLDGADGVREYRRIVASLGRVTLLATDSGSPWLAGTVASIPWVTWTPSFPLMRERDLWSCLIAARTASRFGPTVINRYFDVLERTRNVLDALDALAGLTAIGLRHPPERDGLLRRLEAASQAPDWLAEQDAETVALGYHEVQRQLINPTTSAIPPSARQVDAFAIDATGRIPFFAMILEAVERPAWTLMPPIPKRTYASGDVAETFESASSYSAEQDGVPWLVGHA